MNIINRICRRFSSRLVWYVARHGTMIDGIITMIIGVWWWWRSFYVWYYEGWWMDLMFLARAMTFANGGVITIHQQMKKTACSWAYIILRIGFVIARSIYSTVWYVLCKCVWPWVNDLLPSWRRMTCPFYVAYSTNSTKKQDTTKSNRALRKILPDYRASGKPHLISRETVQSTTVLQAWPTSRETALHF